MAVIAQPIVMKIKDNREALDFFEKHTLPEEPQSKSKVIIDFTTVYIHNWKDTSDYEVYVGEA